jgi:hypothetical protein
MSDSLDVAVQYAAHVTDLCGLAEAVHATGNPDVIEPAIAVYALVAVEAANDTGCEPTEPLVDPNVGVVGVKLLRGLLGHLRLRCVADDVMSDGGDALSIGFSQTVTL